MDKLIDLIKSHPEQINALAAVCALFVSFLSILLTFLTLRLQRIHNFKSLTPIGSILISDYENELEVKIKNTGVGPLIIEQFSASDGNHEEQNIISWMPQLPEGIYWTIFINFIEGRCIPPGQDLIVIQLNGDPDDKVFTSVRDKVRYALSTLVVNVEYKDIYDRKMSPAQRNLNWFARHLAELDAQTRKELK
jgi:hypothetical protein